MPQLEIRQSNWGRLLLVNPDQDEFLYPADRYQKNEEWSQLLLWPVCFKVKGKRPRPTVLKEAFDKVSARVPEIGAAGNQTGYKEEIEAQVCPAQLAYRISGLVSLAEARRLPFFTLHNDLQAAAALCRRLHFLADHLPVEFLAISDQLIFLPCSAGGEPLWNEPLFLFLPIIPDKEPIPSIGSDCSGLLAEISEPLVRLAQREVLFSADLTDSLLIGSWDKPLNYLKSILPALQILERQQAAAEDGRDRKGTDMRAPLYGNPPVDKADRNTVNQERHFGRGRREKMRKTNGSRPHKSKQGPGKKVNKQNNSGHTKSSMKTATESNQKKKRGRLIGLLILQLLLLPIVFHLNRGADRNDLSWLGLVLLTCLFLILNLIFLLQKHSPLRSSKSRFDLAYKANKFRDGETGREATLPPDDVGRFPEISQPAPPAQPPARLIPEELLFREKGDDEVRAQACFRPGAIADLYFAVGQDPRVVDLCLNTEEIAPLQAEILFNGEAYLLRCCRPATGRKRKKPDFLQETRLNGVALEAFSDRPLRDQDLISFGRYLYRFDCPSV